MREMSVKLTPIDLLSVKLTHSPLLLSFQARAREDFFAEEGARREERGKGGAVGARPYSIY